MFRVYKEDYLSRYKKDVQKDVQNINIPYS